MRLLGCAMVAGSLLFFWATGHAISMYQATGDVRWFLTIVSGPLFGLVTLTLGSLFARGIDR